METTILDTLMSFRLSKPYTIVLDNLFLQVKLFAITRSETEIMAPERPSILLAYYVEQDTDMLHHTHIEFDPTARLDPKEQAYADLLIRAYNSGELQNFKTSAKLKSLLLKDAKEMLDSFMAKPTKIERATQSQLPRSSS